MKIFLWISLAFVLLALNMIEATPVITLGKNWRGNNRYRAKPAPAIQKNPDSDEVY